MITVAQAAKKLGITEGRVRQLIAERRIKGAQKIGRDWYLPDNPAIAPPKKPRGGQKRAMK